MNDQEFRDQYHPLHVPAHFDAASPLKERLAFALADLGEGTADEVVKHFIKLEGNGSQEEEALQLLALWDKNGQITVNTLNGEKRYNLHKITQANDGSVNPRLLAPGLD